MKKVKIVTDSSITVNDDYLKKYSITVVPLSVMIDGTIYSEANLSGAEFMNKMAQATNLPKTSQPAIGNFIEVYKNLIKDGSIVISLHITKDLSGTVEAARQASNMVNGEIHVLDSGFTDQALAFQVIEAAKMAQANKDIMEILDKINLIKKHTRLFVGMSTMENLVKGGRISRVTGFLTGILNIKAVMELTLNDGLKIVAKGRGEKTFWKWLDEFLTNLKDKSVEITKLGISHADGLEIAKKISESVKKFFPNLEIQIMNTGAVIATHTGPRAFAVMYYTE